MANARITLGSLFGAINSAATSVSSVFDTTTKGINMANKYVSDAAEKQHIRSVVDMHDYAERLAEEKAMEETLRKKEIIEFTKVSDENHQLFNESYNRIKSLIEKRND